MKTIAINPLEVACLINNRKIPPVIDPDILTALEHAQAFLDSPINFGCRIEFKNNPPMKFFGLHNELTIAINKLRGKETEK